MSYINVQSFSVLFKKAKPFVFFVLFSSILLDIVFLKKNSDGIYFGILILYIFSVGFYKTKSKTTFIFCLVLLGLMYLEYLFTGTSEQTEIAAVWLVLLLAVGIVQQGIELFRMNTETSISENIKKVIVPLFSFKNWWVFYLDYFNLLGRKELTYQLYKGITFAGKAGDADGLIINEVWGSKIYTPNAAFQINDTDTVIDIGAHKGYFTVYASKHAKNGNVYSFEPTNKNYSYLAKNVQLNNCTNVHLNKLGVANKKSERKIYEYSEQAGGISMIKDWFADKKKVKASSIKCITLEDVFKQNKIKKVDFMKLDCEGAEHEILLSSSAATMKKIEKISMEYHEIGELTAKGLIAFLKKNKFKVKQVHMQGSIGQLYATK
jgi:FkbM family methyltransferase